MNFEPVFVLKPERWPVLSDCTTVIALTPTASGDKRHVKLGCTFRACELFVEVPISWNEDRVNNLIGRFRAAGDARMNERRGPVSRDEE